MHEEVETKRGLLIASPNGHEMVQMNRWTHSEEEMYSI